MPIHVITSGPLGDNSRFNVPSFSSLNDCKQIIEDELDDTQGEYGSQIESAIVAAISFYEGEVFYFNEQTLVFVTTPYQERVDSEEVQNALLGLQEVSLVQEGRGSVPLAPLAFKEFTRVNAVGQQGQPHYYSCFGGSLYLSPIPDKAYTIQLVSSPARLEPITDKDAPHPWFVHAFALIKARAKYLLYRDVVQDRVAAQIALRDCFEAYNVLKAKTSRQLERGAIVATEF